MIGTSRICIGIVVSEVEQRRKNVLSAAPSDWEWSRLLAVYRGFHRYICSAVTTEVEGRQRISTLLFSE